MCSIRLSFQPPKAHGREGTICYLIEYGKRRKKIRSRHCVLPSEWDARRAEVAVGRDGARLKHICGVRDSVRRDLNRLSRIINRLKRGRAGYSAADVADEYFRYMREYSLLSFMDKIIQGLRHNGRIRTAETYAAARNSFRKFLVGNMNTDSLDCENDIMLDCISTEVMEAYEAWLKTRGNSLNTISFYVRIIRAVYNRAVECDVIENRRPFSHVYTGVERTIKRALPLSVISRINNLELVRMPELDYARDMFMLSFMLRGMSFVDMAFLRKTDLNGGYVSYRRRKTGQMLVVKWTKEMQRILAKYPENDSMYLLPIIRHPGTNERRAYLNASYSINHNLKRVAERLGIRVPLTLYVARHSWASAARMKGVPVSVISEGLGHDSEATTRIYLANLDTSVVDMANSLILSAL